MPSSSDASLSDIIYNVDGGKVILALIPMGVLARSRSRKRRRISQPGSGRSGDALREEHGNMRGLANGINLKAQRQY